MTAGIDLIAAERQRQIDRLGYDIEHDKVHGSGELTAAARCYALYAWWQLSRDWCDWTKHALQELILGEQPRGDGWPWDELWWDPSEDPVRNLVKAAALIAAEIDRAAS